MADYTLKSPDLLEQELTQAVKNGALEAIKLCYKHHKHDFTTKQLSAAISLGVLKKQFACTKYLMDLTWHLLGSEEKAFVLKTAALIASESSQNSETIRDNTKFLALLLKKYTPTFAEGTIFKLKKDYPKAFENLNNPHAQKTNGSFMPMYKSTKLKQKPVKATLEPEVKKPMVLVNIMEDGHERISGKLKISR